MLSTSGKCDGKSKTYSPPHGSAFFSWEPSGCQEAAMEGSISPGWGETEPEL